MNKSHVCENCIHFASGDAYGLDEKTGYCDVWEKIVKVDHTCERFEERGKDGFISKFATAHGADVDEAGDEESELEMPEDKDTILNTLPDDLREDFMGP